MASLLCWTTLKTTITINTLVASWVLLFMMRKMTRWLKKSLLSTIRCKKTLTTQEWALLIKNIRSTSTEVARMVSMGKNEVRHLWVTFPSKKQSTFDFPKSGGLAINLLCKEKPLFLNNEESADLNHPRVFAAFGTAQSTPPIEMDHFFPLKASLNHSWMVQEALREILIDLSSSKLLRKRIHD